MVFTEEAISSLHFYGINYCMFDFKYLCKFSISKVNCLTMVVTFDLVSPVFRLFSSHILKTKTSYSKQRDERSMPNPVAQEPARHCLLRCGPQRHEADANAQLHMPASRQRHVPQIWSATSLASVCFTWYLPVPSSKAKPPASHGKWK